MPKLPESITGSSYQVDKFLKHTVPASSDGVVSVFDDPSTDVYMNYSIDCAMSGSVEVDDQNRVNVVWVASKPLGQLFVDGVPQGGVDAVKLVLTHDAHKVHAFPTSSAEIRTTTCATCGGPIAF